jgi:class 3 adenylate cyclase
MKTFFFAVAFLFCNSLLIAQSTGPQAAETNQNAPGQDLQKFQQLIAQSEQAYTQGDFQQAANYAETAVEVAEGLHNLSYSALALHHQGKALLKIGGNRRGNGINLLERSIQLAKVKKNISLALANLELLRGVAHFRGKDREVAKIEQQMAELGGLPVVNLASSPVVTDAKTSAKEDNQRVVAELSNLADELATQSKQNNQSAQIAATLSKERQQLMALIGTQQTAISSMSEKQAKDQLMIARQSKLVDSLNYEKQITSMELANKENEIQRKNSEIELKNSQRNLILALSSIIFIIAAGVYNRYRNMKTHNVVLEEKNKIIQEERQRSENLLLNILPVSVAEELKRRGHADTRSYERATVLFSDFKNFTRISEMLTPEELVKELDYCFKGFDKIITKYGLEKIKTIGDAYMCAGGLPDPNTGHPVKVVHAALEIQQFLGKLKAQREKEKRPFFEARVGIHTGPLIAGVVGDIKFAYDIWGDTVNVAARMESSSEPGKVNISAATYNLVKDEFNCDYRGKIEVKNKGEVDMYFVQN